MYSIIYQNKIIDVVQNPTFVKVLPSGHVTFTDRFSANGIIGSDKKTIYGFKKVSRPNTKIVNIEEISKKEFNRLKGLLNSGKSITADFKALANVIDETISKLSNICNSKIVEGFSVRLADGKKYTFSLTIEDQLNILNLENQLNSDCTSFIYHSAGQPCKSFTRAEVLKIVEAYRKHILYHTTYFNVAKQYVKSLTDIDDVKAFTYGTNLSNIVKDNAIKQILKNGSIL